MQAINGKKYLCAVLALALVILCAAPSPARAESGDAAADDAPLAYQLVALEGANEGREVFLSDGDVSTCVRLRRNAVIEAILPDGAAFVYVVWHSVPEAPQLRFIDGEGNDIDSIGMDGTLLCQSYPIPQGCARLQIGAASELAVSELAIYKCLPKDILLPEGPPEKTDVLLIVAHTGDEAYYFGGLAPIVAGEKGYSLTVLFLSHKSRMAQQEAMRSLYDCGVKAQPLFADFNYRVRPYGSSAGWLGGIWKGPAVTTFLYQQIRLLRPEIVITHDAAGEDGDAIHAYTAELVRLAIERAYSNAPSADGATPAWEVARLYEHSASGGDVMLPVDCPLPAFDGRTARELAWHAYDGYTFLRVFHNADGAADAPGYTLVETWREPERDPMEDMEIGPMPTPVPTPSPTPEPTPVSAPEPPPTSIAGGEPLAGEGDAPVKRVLGYRLWILGAGAALSAALFLWLVLSRAKKTFIRFILCAVPLALSLLLALALPAARDAFAAARTPEATPTLSLPPAVTPTPTPTAAPSPTPPEAPTPTPDPDAAYFRQEGEPAEVVVFDNKNDVYAYHSDTLSVEIQRYDAVKDNGKPLRYYVAHLRVRGANEFRPGHGTYLENGRSPNDPIRMARRYKAVLAITGDNMIHSDVEKKSVILRDGRMYLDRRVGSTMILTPDGRSMYSREGAALPSAQFLLDAGIENTFSFGPILISGGVVNENADQHYLAIANPRVGIGLVEEGHFVIIVVDGRTSTYSEGARLGEFADMFAEQGCVEAYNLDGGASSCLIFMGEYVNKRMSAHIRDVPDLLMWGYSGLVPDVGAARVNKGSYD